jgi:hypothetical protein
MPTQTAPEKGQEGKATQAVELAKPVEQQALFNVRAFDNNKRVAAVFGLKPVNGKDQNGNQAVVGGSLVMLPKRDIAKALNLTGKGNADVLETQVREIRSEAMLLAKRHVAGLSADWVLQNMKTRVMKDGTEQLTIVARNMPPKDRAMAIKYMVAMGWKLEDAIAEVDAKAGQTVTVETTVTGTKATK